MYLLLASGKKQPWADGYNHMSSSLAPVPPKTSAPPDPLLNESKINLSTDIVNA